MWGRVWERSAIWRDSLHLGCAWRRESRGSWRQYPKLSLVWLQQAKPFQASTSLPATVMRPQGFELPALQLDCNPSKITSTQKAPVHSCLRGGSAAKAVFERALESEPQISHSSFLPSTIRNEMFTCTQNYVRDLICPVSGSSRATKTEYSNSQPWNVLPSKATATNALSCTEKLYMDPRSQILSRCSPTGISIYRKEKTGTARAFLPLVTDGRGGSEEHMPIQGKLHLCPGNRNLSRVILTDLIFQAGGLGREHNT